MYIRRIVKNNFKRTFCHKQQNNNYNFINFYLKSSLCASSCVFIGNMTYGLYSRITIMNSQNNINQNDSTIKDSNLNHMFGERFEKIFVQTWVSAMFAIPKSCVYGFFYPLTLLNLTLDFFQGNLKKGVNNLFIPGYKYDDIYYYIESEEDKKNE